MTKKILDIQIPKNTIIDRMYWSPNKSGSYSTSSAYKKIINDKKPPIDFFLLDLETRYLSQS